VAKYRFTKISRPLDAKGARPTRDPRAEAGIENGVRTDEVVGDARAPKVGEPFVIYAPPLEAGAQRVVSTSPVVEIDNCLMGGKIILTESGSTYHVEAIRD
jgi:hypothetical protein